MKTSDYLTVGEIYTRAQLRSQFSITAASLNNGIFHPSQHDSIWLFVTEDKRPDRVQYVDFLDGDVLYVDGQSKGRTNNIIINHRQDDREVLLFYRKHPTEYPESGFRYEGLFDYYTHEGETPAHFTLYRKKSLDVIASEDISAELEQQEYFEGGAKQRYTSYYERDPKVRAAAIEHYGTQCMACEFDFEKRYGLRGRDYIEVHHTKPVSSLKEKSPINPKTDTIVVCANCHRMIHRSATHVLSLEELKAILK